MTSFALRNNAASSRRLVGGASRPPMLSASSRSFGPQAMIAFVRFAHRVARCDRRASPLLESHGDRLDPGDDLDELAIRRLDDPLNSRLIAQRGDGGNGVDDVAERGEAQDQDSFHWRRSLSSIS